MAKVAGVAYPISQTFGCCKAGVPGAVELLVALQLFQLPPDFQDVNISTFNARGGGTDGGGARPVNVLFSGGGTGSQSQSIRPTMSANHPHSHWHAGSHFTKPNVSVPQTQEAYIEREVYIEMDPSNPSARRGGDDVLGMGMGGMGRTVLADTRMRVIGRGKPFEPPSLACVAV
ncbi:hypothetical protein DFH06DRAFT_1125427 [Mycena polygramma]|nr:hypothetical protein DFH06DRAFT_1125427 [Mycena polygramma]